MFELEYPSYELIFCASDLSDPAVPVVQHLIEHHSRIRARLLIGEDRVSSNPKLNNCVKGWAAAKCDWVIFTDCNVLLPKNYITRLMNCWRPDTGVISSPPVGTNPHGFWAHLECSFLNTYQARWQYLGDTLGLGFAQGKTMMWRRDVFERAGGIHALVKERGEDAASTKAVRKLGLRVRLVDAPFAQPLGYRTAHEILQRQLRWARFRRASFPLLFVFEVLTGPVLPLSAGVWIAAGIGFSPFATGASLALLWYGSEMILASAARWPSSIAYPVYAGLRDLILPVLWVVSWLGTDVIWRGKHIRAAQSPSAV